MKRADLDHLILDFNTNDPNAKVTVKTVNYSNKFEFVNFDSENLLKALQECNFEYLESDYVAEGGDPDMETMHEEAEVFSEGAKDEL